MTDDLVKRLADIDPILDAEFDTQLNVRRDPYGATRAIEMALYLLRDQADRIEALTAERKEDYRRLSAAAADEAHECGIHKARAEAAEADNARLREALSLIAAMGFSDDTRVSANIARMAVHQARAALTGKETK